MEQGVFTARKLKGFDMVLFAEFAIEGRSGFDPFALQIEFHKAMVDKEVRPHKIEELLGCQVIADRCKTDAGRDGAGPSKGAEERRFRHTEASTPIQDVTGTVVFGSIERGVGIISDVIAHGQIELDGAINGIGASSDRPSRTIPDDAVVTVNDAGRS